MSDTAAFPPPVIDCARRLSFAVADVSVEYTGRCGMLVDGTVLGPMTHFVIGRDLVEHDVLLLYCTDNWESAAAAGYGSVEEAKRALERAYRGISAKWVDAPAGEPEVTKYLDEHWPVCAFCGKRAFEVAALIEANDPHACDKCVRLTG